MGRFRRTAIYAAAGIMATTPSVDGSKYVTTSPVTPVTAPHLPTFNSSGEAPSVPSPNQQQSQRTDRMAVDTKRRTELVFRPKQTSILGVSNVTRGEIDRLMAEGDHNGGYRQVEKIRKTFPSHKISGEVLEDETSEETATEGPFKLHRGIAFSTDYELGMRVDPTSPFGKNKAKKGFKNWQIESIRSLYKNHGIELRVYRESRKSEPIFFFCTPLDIKCMKLDERDIRDMQLCRVVLRKLRNERTRYYRKNRRNGRSEDVDTSFPPLQPITYNEDVSDEMELIQAQAEAEYNLAVWESETYYDAL